MTTSHPTAPRRRRAAAAALCLAALALLVPPARADDAAVVALTDCTEVLFSTQVPRDRVEHLVADRFTIAEPLPGRAEVWHVLTSCSPSAGSRRGPTLVMAGVSIAAPPEAQHTTPGLDLQLALLWSSTDDADVAASLSSRGAPVAHVRGLRFTRCATTACDVARLDVPHRGGGYSLRTARTALQVEVPAHQHDLTWWFDRAGGPGSLHVAHAESGERLQDTELLTTAGGRASGVFGERANGTAGVQHAVDTTVTAG